MVFKRDMILNITHQADWEMIKQRKQRLIDKNNEAENRKRKEYTYKEGEKILLRRGTENKMEVPYEGPYEIIKVNDNGTVKLRLENTQETVNIRRIKPYKETT